MLLVTHRTDRHKSELLKIKGVRPFTQRANFFCHKEKIQLWSKLSQETQHFLWNLLKQHKTTRDLKKKNKTKNLERIGSSPAALVLGPGAVFQNFRSSFIFSKRNKPKGIGIVGTAWN